MRVKSRDLVDLLLGDDAFPDKAGFVLEEEVGDLVVALIKGCHEAREDLKLARPLFGYAQRLLSRLAGPFKDRDVLADKEDASEQVATKAVSSGYTA